MIIGKEEELADNFYNTLSAKYYWRDWLVVVYSDKDMYGAEEHWRRSCNKGVTTLVETHWKKRYNIMISSVPSDRKSQPFTGRIKTWKCESYLDPFSGLKKRPIVYSPKKIYESYFPADAKKCKYPLVGVVRRRGKFALRAPENRKFHQEDGWPYADTKQKQCKTIPDTVMLDTFILG